MMAEHISTAEALHAIRNYRFGESRAGLLEIEAMVLNSLDSKAQMSQLALRLAGILETSATNDCKDFICRQLVFIGGDESVSHLAALLDSDETADMARYALEAMPGEVVDSALKAALETSPARVGIINSLGVRKAKSSRSALKRLRNDDDLQVATAARAALKQISQTLR